MPVLNNDSIDDPIAFDAAESFATGQVSFQRASLLAQDAAQLLQDVVIRPLGEARTRRGLRKIGGDRAGQAGEGVQGLIFFSGPVRVQTASVYPITISAAPDGHGSVTGGGVFAQGQTVIVSAAASEGYAFANWTEDDEIVSTDADYGFAVDGPRTLVANFVFSELPSFNYTVAHGNDGAPGDQGLKSPETYTNPYPFDVELYVEDISGPNPDHSDTGETCDDDLKVTHDSTDEYHYGGASAQAWAADRAALGKGYLVPAGEDITLALSNAFGYGYFCDFRCTWRELS